MSKLLFAFALCLSAVSPLRAQSQATIPLYTGTIPNSKPSDVRETSITLPNGGVRVSNVVQPTLTVFRPAAGTANGTAVIICPGGGYARLSIDHEGYDVAKRLNEMGVTAFVLKYRLPNDQSQPDKTTAPLLDVQQALRLVRQRAAEFGVNPARVGVMGFSAGGHLAATAGTHFAKPAAQTTDNTSVRPDFLVLIYPVISFTDSLAHGGSRTALLGAAPAPDQVRLYSNEQQVSAQTPPAFLVHAADDKTVPVGNSLRFYEACVRRGVPAEMHLYPKGGHGFGLLNKTTKDDWMGRLQNWFDANGWLTK
ncbi:alpha/beta hydrolase [Hymenobacter busanensis]|uniref:Alpha/beta hydrolase n=1 Tax=Hymenobacter busanensis TaxID=2607656 RepID=A0A7L5A199_9BACT|nr:alpha/beta hydrolase [Hymenobacter busanensis]KAA9332161.1 alpha/beta hydrolase [Hymenobacter busanensis]QHJ07500.1 prolyl oligopeptidase family serine peptidase [Hymenobacter busanensis]